MKDIQDFQGIDPAHYQEEVLKLPDTVETVASGLGSLRTCRL